MIDGIETEGRRIVTTIPHGAIGNEKVIVNVSEVWYSKDLLTTVMSKRSEPENGEYTYQLTNLKREEPDKSLFTIPADYKIIDETKKTNQN